MHLHLESALIGRHYWQSAVAVVTRCCTLPVRILPLEAATSTLSVTTSRSYKATSTGIHFMSPGLLQLAAVRSDRQTHAASTVSAECCGKADHKSETSRTHHTDRRRVEFKIAISPQKVLLAPSGPLRGESALSLVFTVVLVTDVLLQLDHVSGATYLPVCETRKSAAQNSGNNWKHSCFRRTARRIVTFLIIAPYKYSYLLTYFQRVYMSLLFRV